MSYCRQEGKDQVLFVTKEDHETPIKEELKYLAEEEEPEGLILANGDINWSCPCLGGMASGPCGMEFREAFSCFHYSMAEPKGSDCIDNFRKMQECMVTYPELYPMNEKSDPSESADIVQEASQEEIEKDQAKSETDKENVS
ncbi:mitochondrial intermembrane space import and assembly protein 40-like [Lytechinus pictus]|uniref:mitochondrial intermembrane space import and assembly protein 40-like n=1 Tax=Lytechinus pictus TaxID=7653 RepID=UPI00240D4D6F|nr:mitochondrial intermembrane space import and assembly protein 40-like [Lytechinus pictus]